MVAVTSEAPEGRAAPKGAGDLDVGMTSVSTIVNMCQPQNCWGPRVATLICVS
jgi:hypothetical protein